MSVNFNDYKEIVKKMHSLFFTKDDKVLQDSIRYFNSSKPLEGKLEKGDLGLIEVKDFISFVAVKYSKVKSLLENIKEEKMKGKKYKIEVARKVIKKEEE